MLQSHLDRDDVFWILQSLCIAHNIPFSTAIAQQQLADPFDIKALAIAASLFGLQARTGRIRLRKLFAQRLPMLIWLRAKPSESLTLHAEEGKQSLRPALLLHADAVNALFLERGKALPTTLPLAQLGLQYSGHATRIQATA
ncbi:MAG: hypothetical protein EOP02_21775, partial [Proteobacteria bacterium]